MRVMIFGTFDMLHDGHRFVIQEARKRGETVVVVARDDNVRKIKNLSPSHSQDERQQAIAEEFPDTRVVLGSADDFFAVVKEHEPDLILFGYDQRLPPGMTEDMLPCKTERLPAYHPERYKSSIARRSQQA